MKDMKPYLAKVVDGPCKGEDIYIDPLCKKLFIRKQDLSGRHHYRVKNGELYFIKTTV